MYNYGSQAWIKAICSLRHDPKFPFLHPPFGSGVLSWELPPRHIVTWTVLPLGAIAEAPLSLSPLKHSTDPFSPAPKETGAAAWLSPNSQCVSARVGRPGPLQSSPVATQSPLVGMCWWGPQSLWVTIPLGCLGQFTPLRVIALSSQQIWHSTLNQLHSVHVFKFSFATMWAKNLLF